MVFLNLYTNIKSNFAFEVFNICLRPKVTLHCLYIPFHGIYERIKKTV